MSFLALDDHAETLAAALAFLDAFDGSDSAAASEAQQAPRTRVRKKRPADELLALRGQVAELQARLAHLKRFCSAESRVTSAPSTPTALAAGATRRGDLSSPDSVDTGGGGSTAAAAATTGATSGWFKCAVREYKQLERARQWNLELRGELEAQQRASTALEQLFRLKLPPEDVAFLEEMGAQQSSVLPVAAHSDTPAANHATFNSDDVQFARLHVYIEQMYASTSKILSEVAIRSIRGVMDSCRTQHDPVFGRSFEYTANVTVPHTFHLVERFVWRQLMMNFLFECGKPDHKRVHLSEANCFAKRHNLVLSEGRERRRARGFAVVRKFVEARRTVVALSSRFQISGTAVLFRKSEFIVVTNLAPQVSSTKSSCDSTPSTLLQTYVCVHAESEGAATLPQPLTREVERLRDALLKFAGSTLDAYKHRLLQTLVKEGGAEFSEQRHRALCLGCFACNLQRVHGASGELLAA